jgi:molecular chaperone GrpE
LYPDVPRDQNGDSQMMKNVDPQKGHDEKHSQHIEQQKKSAESKKEKCCCEDKKTDKVKELTDDLQRLQAEFENYKKRCEKENHKFREYSKADLVKKLLPVLDSMELALKSTHKNDEFVSGVKLIFGQLFSALEDEGLRRINSLGNKFDPYRHEVLMSEKSDKEEGTILEELQPGYMFKEAVLRHSKVKIAKN